MTTGTVALAGMLVAYLGAVASVLARSARQARYATAAGAALGSMAGLVLTSGSA
ncbi:MAG: hypothetical protein ACRD26_25025 [Vicinamibacterales bacterium]